MFKLKQEQTQSSFFTPGKKKMTHHKECEQQDKSLLLGPQQQSKLDPPQTTTTAKQKQHVPKMNKSRLSTQNNINIHFLLAPNNLQSLLSFSDFQNRFGIKTKFSSFHGVISARKLLRKARKDQASNRKE